MEIHIELATKSKMFCGCKNDPFNAKNPNIYTCPVCLAMPGGLPVPNRQAIEWTIKLGLALGCTIPLFSKFDRKHYFYPDLPKGYQISQFDQPFCKDGIVRVPEGDVRIQRVHLEEDTGKLQHAVVDGKKVTLVDFNRSGVPLVEIVTEPDIRSGDQAKAFLKKLHQIIKYLAISGADMEKGSMRLEPNISVCKGAFDGVLPSYKVEVKNINSFNFVKKAIDYEVSRHIDILETGELPKQETRGYDAANSATISQRSKETAEDYRYFPDPDIPPIRFTKDQIETIKQTLPELPDDKRIRFSQSFGLKDSDIDLIIDRQEHADYFEKCIDVINSTPAFDRVTPYMVAKALINSRGVVRVSETEFVQAISDKLTDLTIDPLILVEACRKITEEHHDAVESYHKGKESVIMFLIGQVKKELKGKGDAEKIKEELLMQLT